MASKEPRLKQESATVYALADIRGLARILSQFDLSEVEVESAGQRIRLRRERAGVAAQVLAPAAPVLASLPAAAPAAAAAPQPEPSDGSSTITSPFVGTFYRAPSPESAAFVEVGQTARKGQVLCIVEAMKLMNEIEAEGDCKIVEILVKNAEPVEYGQPLFKVFPLA